MKLTLGFSRLKVYGGLGAFEHEKTGPREYWVSVSMTYRARRAIAEDSLNLAIDYSKIAEEITKIVGARHYDLIETAAHDIFIALKSKYKLRQLEVLVEKPRPADLIEKSFVKIGTKTGLL